MTYPAAPYPQQPQPQQAAYAPPAPGYPPQAPPAPYGAPAPGYGYPPQDQPPAGYGAPGYPPAGYGAPAYAAPQAPPAAAPPQPAAVGTVDDWLGQSTSGAASLSKIFQGKAPGSVTVSFTVARKIMNSDVKVQTDPDGKVKPLSDGSWQYVLAIPCRVTGSSDGSHAVHFPDGSATWWVRGQAKEALMQGMSAAGVPGGLPEEGARIDLTWTHDRPAGRAGYNPSHQYNVVYGRPATAPGQPQPAIDAGALQAATATAPQPAPPQPAPEPPAAPAASPPQPQFHPNSAPPDAFTQPYAPAPQGYAVQPQQLPAPAYPQPQAPGYPAAPAAYPQAPGYPQPQGQLPGVPAGLTAEQAAALASLKAQGALPAAPAA